MRGSRIAPTMLLILMTGILSARGQAPPSELARQHLESGIQFYEQQRYKQALNDFQIIVSSMGDTEYADDALLHIGQYYLDVEEDPVQSQKHFQALLERYPTGDKAPGAYYYLGMVSLRSNLAAGGVDDAMANFQRVIRLYPQSPYVAAALAATGAALERSHRWEEAIGAYFRVVSEHPHSAWAPEAQLAIGRSTARQGNPVQAMIELQQVRNLYPESEEAKHALDFLTLLFRLYGSPELGQPTTFQVDSRFRPAMADGFKNVQSIRLSATGVHVVEEGRKRVLNFDRSGKLVSTQSAADPKGLSVDARGTMMLANKNGLVIDGTPLALTIPEENGPKQLENITAGVRDRLGDLYVYDDGEKRILRFDPQGKLKGSFPDSSQRQVLRMDMDPSGNLVVLEEKDRSITAYSPTGARVGHIEKRGATWEFKKPVDVAIDAAGYVYVLDQDLAQLGVFDPSYQFVTLLSRQSLGGGTLEKPITLDVDRSGDLYVYDDKAQSIIRLH